MDNEKELLNHSGIKGMKWGVRRYQNADGTLTEAGRKRYAQDVKSNKIKKTDKAPVNQWVRDDIKKAKNEVDTYAKVVKTTQDTVDKIKIERPKKRMDLSNMTNKELQDRINREQLESRYNELFNKTKPTKVEKGKAYVSKTLATAGAGLTVAGSALSIALMLKQLKE